MLRNLSILVLIFIGFCAPAQSIRFPAELRLRAIEELRKELAGDEFQHAMHAAEGLSRAGFGASVAYDLRVRLKNETDGPRCDVLTKKIALAETPVRSLAAAVGDAKGQEQDFASLAKALKDADADTRGQAAAAIVRITNQMLALDSDGDGIPDSVERELGIPPDDPERLVRFYTAEAKGPGANDPEALPPEITGAWFGHLAGDRYVWIYEFGSAFSEMRTVFHSYLRLDGDASTGRQGGANQGVDVMYSFVDARNDPRIFTKELRVNMEWPVRGLVAGNRIYVCDDVRVQRVEGKAVIGVNLLSERYPNARTQKKSGRSTPRTEVSVDLRASRSLPELAFPETSGFERVTPSYAARYALRYDKGNVPLAVTEGDGDGFERHYDGYIQSVAAQPAEMTLAIPVSGRYRLAFLALPVGSGMSGLQVEVDGESLGAVAVTDRTYPGTIFVSSKRRFRKDEKLILRVNDRGAAGRFGDFALVKNVPEGPPFTIENLSSAILPASPGEPYDSAEVVWTTNRVATCKINLSTKGMNQTFAIGAEPGVNHRFIIPPAFRTKGCKAQVSAETADGASAVSPSIRVVVERVNPGRRSRRAGRLSLTVAEPATKGRLAWPVTSGVPFARGILADGSRCRVLNASGEAVPAQFRELSRWSDGSVKWLLIDTLVDTCAGKDTALVLEYNVDPVEGAGVIVRETSDGVTLDSGSVRLVLDRTRFEPLAGALSGALDIADPEGHVFSSANLAPDEMVVEERGPVRATVRVRGRFADSAGKTWMRYLCRIHMVAGQPWARVEVSLENDVVDPMMSRISRFELPLVLAGKAQFGAHAASHLLQDYDNRFLLDGQPREGHAPGYCRVGSTTVAVRDFWQLYPKGFQTDGSTLRVQFMPPLLAEQYQSEEDKKLEDRLYFWCDKGTYKIRTGTRFTTEFAVDLSGAMAPDDFDAWIQHPLFAACTPDEYCASAVWGAMTPRMEDVFTRYEGNVNKAFDDFLARREKVQEYGFFNFGDWYGERKWNWGNVEYDTHFALGIHFLRTGDQRMLDRAEEAAAHNGDVDTLHYDARPGNVGRPWAHSVGHTGGYYPSDFKDMGGFNTGGRGLGHTWCRGHFLLWNLTGNERFHDAGREVAHYQTAVAPCNPRMGTNRDGGWTLVGAIGAYQATGDPYYLNGARVLVERILDKQRPNGQWGHPIWECRDEYPRPWGCKPFMTGVILHALSIFDRVEPTPRVQDAIRRGAAYLWEKTYVPDQHGFIYAEAPRFQGKGGIWTMTLVGDGLAYACRLDPKQKYRDLLLDGLSYNMYRAGVSSFGKSFTQGLCFTVYMLDELHKLGITNPPAVVTPPDMRLRSHLVLPPGQTTTIRPQVKLDGGSPATCTITFGGRAGDFIMGPATVSWQAIPGFTLGPEIRVQAPGKPGTAVLPVTVAVGDRKEERKLSIEAVEPSPNRSGATGWVTGSGDPLAIAAKKLNRAVTPIADLANADLDRYRVIVIGDEAHEKNFAGCRAAAQKVNRWVIQGGMLLVGQMNDGKWQPDFLPCDLVLHDDGTEAGAIVSPGDPLFAGLKGEDLVGVTSYDRIDWAAPEWQVLMKAEDGTPAILSARCGAGRILVVMPSFDREVSKETSSACDALVRNIFSWISM